MTNSQRPNEYTFLVYKLLSRTVGVIGSEAEKTYYRAEIVPPDPPLDSISQPDLELLARDVVKMYITRMAPLDQAQESREVLNIKYEPPAEHRFTFSFKNLQGLSDFHDCVALDQQEKDQFSRCLWEYWLGSNKYRVFGKPEKRK